MVSASQHVKTQPRKRSQAEKKGRTRYAFEKISAIERDINEIKRLLRRLSEGLDPFLIFDKDFIISMACEDEVDRAVLDVLRTAGSAGILPKDILPQVEHYGLQYWHITRRIKRINRRLERKIGKRAAEKRGLKWALTSFMNGAWGGTEEEISVELG
ncbi:MAG: hypothetical protein OEZ35_00205 [Candidatus Bathyarchaeota archaeon]|nr:hypothetical protein [Candidatus Bathyarchaeota archaeon]